MSHQRAPPRLGRHEHLCSDRRQRHGRPARGRRVARCALRAEVRILGRSSAEHPVDVQTGSGLTAALAGCDVAVDASNGSPRAREDVLVDGARQVVSAYAKVGVGHSVCVSIVGIEQLPTRYYRAKVAQEEIVKSASVPSWSIVRSTQFHELVDCHPGRLRALAAEPAQPCAPAAGRSAGGRPGDRRRRAGPPAGSHAHRGSEDRQHQRAGPHQNPGARASRAGARSPCRRASAARRPLRAGALTCPNPDHRGSVPFETWLTARP